MNLQTRYVAAMQTEKFVANVERLVGGRQPYELLRQKGLSFEIGVRATRDPRHLKLLDIPKLAKAFGVEISALFT